MFQFTGGEITIILTAACVAMVVIVFVVIDSRRFRQRINEGRLAKYRVVEYDAKFYPQYRTGKKWKNFSTIVNHFPHKDQAEYYIKEIIKSKTERIEPHDRVVTQFTINGAEVYEL